MADSSITLTNFRHRYLVDETTLDTMQQSLVDLPRGTFEGLVGAAVLQGFGVTPASGMTVSVAGGLAIAASGYVDVIPTATSITLTAPTATQRCLVVVSASPTLTDPIPDPMNANSTWYLETLQSAVVQVLSGVQSNSAPAYPAKGANDAVICGVRLYPGQTSIALTDLDFTVRETVGKNAVGIPSAARWDDRLRPYLAGTAVVGVKPSQLPAPSLGFSYVLEGQPSLFPKSSGGAYNGSAGDATISLQTGTVAGSDGASPAFSAVIPASGTSVVATISLTPTDTLTVAYGPSGGTRAQCLTAVMNQQTTGAGAVTLIPGAKLLGFAVVSSSDGANVSEVDLVDARGQGTLGAASPLPIAEQVQAASTVVSTTGNTTSGSAAVTNVPLSEATTCATQKGSRLLTGIASMTGVVVGAGVSGAGIPAGTTLEAVGGSQATMSAAATATGSGVALTVGFIVPVGTAVSGAGVPASTYVAGVSGTTVTMSQNATATASGVALTFSHSFATGSDSQTQLDQLDAAVAAGQQGVSTTSPKVSVVTMVSQSTPSTNPPAGQLDFYAKGDTLATKNSAGTESLVGSGSGEKNYVQSSSNTAAGWTAFGNVVASTDTTAADLPRPNTTQTGWKLTPSGVAQGTCTISIAVAAVITAAGHGLKTGMVVMFTTTGSLPSSVVAGTAYYATVIDANTFKLSTTQANLIAGTFVSTFGGSQSGTHSFYYGGAYLRATVDPADYGAYLKWAHAQAILSGATGDWEIDAYTNTASDYSGTYTRIPLMSTDALTTAITQLPNATGTFRTTLSGVGSAAPYIELRYNKCANNTHALVGSDLVVGPSTQNQTGARTALSNQYNATIAGQTTNPSLGTGSAFVSWERDGDEMILVGVVQAAGGTIGSGEYTLPLPAGFNINYAAYGSNAGQNNTVGDCSFSSGFSGTGAVVVANAGAKYTDYLRFQFGTTGNWNSTNFSLATNQIMSFNARVPILQWVGNGVLNVLNDSKLSPVKAGIIMPFAGATAPTGWQLCDGSTLSQASYPDLYAAIGATWATCQNPTSGSAYSAPSAGLFRVPDMRGVFLRGAGTSVSTGGGNSVTTALAGYHDDTLASHSHTLNLLLTANVGVQSGQAPYGNNASTSPNMTSQATGSTETAPRYVGVNYIIKLFNDVLDVAGLGLYQPNVAAGFVPVAGLPSDTSGTAKPAGTVGRVLTASASASVGASSTVALTSLTIPAGVWLITGVVWASWATSAANSPQANISTTSGNASAPANYLGYGALTATGVTGGNGTTLSMTPFTVALSSPTTYYVNAFQSSSNSQTMTGTIQAACIA